MDGKNMNSNNRIFTMVLFLCFFGFTQPAMSEDRVVSLSLVDGVLQSSDQTLRFTRGDRVVVRWSSDQALELHLHGYDVKTAVAPGKVAEMVFEAAILGRFPVNSHGATGHAHGEDGGTGKVRLGHGEKAVVYFEVRP
jgi:hypothetical protein